MYMFMFMSISLRHIACWVFSLLTYMYITSQIVIPTIMYKGFHYRFINLTNYIVNNQQGRASGLTLNIIQSTVLLLKVRHENNNIA